MATNLKQKRKKLYFDLSFARTVTNQIVPCTQITNGTPGDRYGGLLDVVVAAQGGTASETKAKNAVSAWFVPNTFAGVTNLTAPAAEFFVDFVSPKAKGFNVTGTGLPYLTGTAGGGLTVVTAFAGHEAIYSITAGTARHFAARVRRKQPAGGTITCTGTLYVQRQNTLEV